MGDLNRVSHAAAKITILPGLEGYIDLNSLPFQGHKSSDVCFEEKNLDPCQFRDLFRGVEYLNPQL